MTAAWFLGAATGVPQDESDVRSTVEPIRHDNETAEAQHDPGWNEFETDESGELTGLSPRTVGGNTTDTQKYSPWWAGLASAQHNVIVDSQVASSGTAARREEAGQQGHGTMQYAVSLEPVLREGQAYGNTYFESNPAGLQEGAGSYMTPPDQDNWLQGLAQSRAQKASRSAYQASLYQSLLT